MTGASARTRSCRNESLASLDFHACWFHFAMDISFVYCFGSVVFYGTCLSNCMRLQEVKNNLIIYLFCYSFVRKFKTIFNYVVAMYSGKQKPGIHY